MDAQLARTERTRLTQTNTPDIFAAFLTLGVIVAAGLVREKEVSYD